ncbi:MAG TPA: phospholipid carrier-dependent glycosyltransferase, partial [Geobacteraceae bacterium]|nr:phospholipid carrier-dependent glycosyltransferase [Geobacteraceae bacterium]
PLALKVLELAGPDAVVASFGYDQTLPFYAGRRTVVVGNVGELEFGSNQGDQSAWFMKENTFYPLWDGNRPVLTILGKGELETLRSNVKKTPRVIMENRRKTLVANF